MPVMPAHDATAAQTNHYGRVYDIFKSNNLAKSKLKSMILASFNEALLTETEDKVNKTAHADRSIEFLISHMVTNYGGSTTETVRFHKTSLMEASITSESDFASGINRLIGDFVALDNINQSKSSSDQMDIVCAACKTLPNVMRAITLYKEKYPDIDDQSVEQLKVFVIKQKSNFDADSAGYMGGASAKKPAPADNSEIIAKAVAQGVAQALAQFANKQKSNAQSTNNAQPPEPKKQATPKANKAFYCFFHGAGHSGGHCNWMDAKRSNDFTQAQRECTVPGQWIDGKLGHA
jgi:hypothetical protein